MKSVLIADDHKDILGMMCDWLQHEGYRTLMVQSLTQFGYHYGSSVTPTLVVIDDMHSNGAGVQRAEALFAQGQKVLITSVLPGSNHDVPRLPKPFAKEREEMREKFMAKVHELIGPANEGV